NKIPLCTFFSLSKLISDHGHERNKNRSTKQMQERYFKDRSTIFFNRCCFRNVDHFSDNAATY
ncbi:MAG: hypothetical protein ACTHOB_02285, partial [Ginsengibacter sp.]